MKRVVVALLGCALTACRSSAPKPADYGFVPEFHLTDQSGHPFDSAVLRGRVWIADFFFTTCGDICPRMTGQMHQLQSALEKVPHVRLVSFTVDPKRDTPQVLDAYSHQHHASARIWYFLTGPADTLQKLDRDVFKLGNVDGSLIHSNRFVLVDSRSHIRGYYDTSEPESIPQLVKDVHGLLRERGAG